MNGLDLDNENQPLNPEGEEPTSMSLLGGIARPDDMPATDPLGIGEGAKSKLSKLPQSSLLIAGILVIAGVAIFLMRSTQGDLTEETIAADVRAKIDQAVAKFSNQDAMSVDDPLQPDNIDQLFEDTEAVVAMFATDYTQQQVPVEYVKKNPFILGSPDDKDDDGKSDDKKIERQYQNWLTALKSEVKQLRLEAVMGGSSPVAFVNGSPVKVGDKLGSFTVSELEAQAIKLSATFEPTGKQVVVRLKMPD